MNDKKIKNPKKKVRLSPERAKRLNERLATIQQAINEFTQSQNSIFMGMQSNVIEETLIANNIPIEFWQHYQLSEDRGVLTYTPPEKPQGNLAPVK